MTSATRMYWWSPRRGARSAWPEVKDAWRGWYYACRNAPFRLLTNFGDELSPLVYELVTGRRAVWSPPAEAELAGVGSIIDLLELHGFSGRYWGTGARSSAGPAGVDVSRVIAVRGPATRAALGLPSGTTLGDPGLLAGGLVSPRTLSSSRISVVPHFRTWNSPLGRKQLAGIRDLGAELVTPVAPPLKVVSEIRDSAFVISSSLHGVVVSHALGVPVVWLRGIGDHSEPDHKYSDYFATVGLDPVTVPQVTAADLIRSGRLSHGREMAADIASTLQGRAHALANGLATAIGVA